MEEGESVYQVQSQRLRTVREYLTHLFCKLQQEHGSAALQTCMEQHIWVVQARTVVAVSLTPPASMDAPEEDMKGYK